MLWFPSLVAGSCDKVGITVLQATAIIDLQAQVLYKLKFLIW
jgi:hypothetical protein